MQVADSIAAANENQQEDCAAQEVEMLHYIARELATMFVDAYRYQNRGSRRK